MNTARKFVQDMPENTHLQFILQDSRFCLFEQKQWMVDLMSPAGTEILIRIPNPNNPATYLSTVKWIRFVETQPQIGDLTLKIIEKLLRNAKKLNADFGPYYINVPPPVITPRFVAQVKTLLDDAGMPYNLIGIEVTERLPVLNVSLFKNGIDALKALGMSLALDDYGQGYATMQFLKDICFDRVKIDRKLLLAARNSDAKRLAVRSLLDFAAEFNVDVIAEGIESEADYTFAYGLGCNGVQGYHIDLPKMLIPVDD